MSIPDDDAGPDLSVADELDPDSARDVAPASRGRSRADELRAGRAERKRTGPKPLELVVPGGDAVIIYKPLHLSQIRRAAGRGSGLMASTDLLIAACKRIDLRDPETGERWPAAEDTDRPADPVRFDGRLAELLGLDGDTPADILLALFEHSDRAIVGQARRLDAWSGGEDLDAAPPEELEERLGEADAATPHSR